MEGNTSYRIDFPGFARRPDTVGIVLDYNGLDHKMQVMESISAQTAKVGIPEPQTCKCDRTEPAIMPPDLASLQ